MRFRGFTKVAKTAIRQLGRKMTSDNLKVVGRKIHNTVRDIAHYAAPIAEGVSYGAALTGHPEISATAATVGQIAKRISR
jgi:hypothetical protein